MNEPLSRRQILAGSGLCVAASVTAWNTVATHARAANGTSDEPFRYCLNTGTISGHELSIEKEVEVTGQAGYAGIEIWTRKLRKYAEEGKSLLDLRKRIADAGVVVENAIGFSAWGAEEEETRKKALAELQLDMDLLAQIGGLRIAAAPAGINRTPGVDLNKVAERYRAVLELGGRMGLVPQLEIWGSALTLGRVSEAAFVAVQAQHPDACLLLDAFHIYKGNSGFDGLRLLNGAAMHVFHINDYPADPPRETITDAHRVFPGDGVAPLGQLIRTLHQTGFRGALSLELFNREYWKQDALAVARMGLEKTRMAVRKALG